MIEGNRIRFNRHGDEGAGLYQCGGYIRRNLIQSNVSLFFSTFGQAFGQGAGLYECDGPIEHNIISNNVAGITGSGLLGCDGPIRFNTIVDNQTFDSEHAAQLFGCSGSISNCIIVSEFDPPLLSSSPATYSCLSDWRWGGTGSIYADPAFVDRENGDFRLSPNSPCVDAGREISDATLDFAWNPRGIKSINVPRGDGSGYDIGAFEYQGPFILASDADGSQTLDEIDLFDFSSGWGAAPADSDPRDFDASSSVDALDLFVLLDDWRQVTDAQ
jgi:hypothetical protein